MSISSSEASQDHLESADLLDESHRQVLERAVRNILVTELAEKTYAQILDGLPAEEAIEESYRWIDDHPVHLTSHAKICAGYIDRARRFRTAFDLSELRFQSNTLFAFNNANSGSKDFHLRLIELIVVTCHQIGAYLFELDDGAHPHAVYQEWAQKVQRERESGVESRRFIFPPAIAFAHPFYRHAEQYPRGLADVAGYWAEAKIFGGVVVFDRGESEDQCNSMWIHGDLIRGPRTLYPPTEEQLGALIAFLLTSSDDTPPCPLPIRATTLNRPRWHPYHAFAEYHIFRDRHERVVPPQPPVHRDVRSGVDWPELNDQHVLGLRGLLDSDGAPYVTEEQLVAAEAGIHNITPSSPLWHAYGTGQSSAQGE